MVTIRMTNHMANLVRNDYGLVINRLKKDQNLNVAVSKMLMGTKLDAKIFMHYFINEDMLIKEYVKLIKQINKQLKK